MKIVDACIVGNVPAPAFERLLNQVLSTPAPFARKPQYKALRYFSPASNSYIDYVGRVRR